MTTQLQLTGGAVLVGVGLLVGGLVLWRASRVAGEVAGQVSAAAEQAWEGVKDGASTVGGWVNPVSDQNLAYQGANAFGSWVTGNNDWNLGGEFHGWINPAPAPAPAPIRSGGGGNFQGTGTDEPPPTYFEQFGISP